MSAPNRKVKHMPGKRTTYILLFLIMIAFMAAAGMFASTVTAEGWNLSQGFPIKLFAVLFFALCLAFLAGAGRKNPHGPPVTLAALGGLVSLILGYLPLILGPAAPFAIGLLAVVVTAVLLPIGWHSDAKHQKLKVSVADYKLLLAERDATILKLQAQKSTVSGHKSLLTHPAFLLLTLWAAWFSRMYKDLVSWGTR